MENDVVFPDLGAPVSAPAPTPRRSRRRRLFLLPLLLIVTILTIGGAVAAIGFLGRGTPTNVGWLPDAPLSVVEIALAPSAGQTAALVNQITRLSPSVDANTAQQTNLLKDQVDSALASFDTSLDDLTSWGGDVITLAAYAPAEGSSMPGLLIAIDTRDREAAGAWLSRFLAKSDPAAASEEYAGVTLTVAGTSAGAIDGELLLLGSPESVRAAIDTKGAGPLLNNADFNAALRAAGEERLAFVYLAPRSLVRAIYPLLGSFAGLLLPAPTSEPLCLEFDPVSGACINPDPATLPIEEPTPTLPSLEEEQLAKVPSWLALAFRAKDDGFALEIATPHSVEFTTSGHPSRLAKLIPASSYLSFDLRDAQVYVNALRSQAAKLSPSSEATIDSLLGDISWLGDLALFQAEPSTGSVSVALLEVSDAGAGLRALLGRLGLGEPLEGAIGSTPLFTYVSNGEATLSYAMIDGAAVISTAPETVSAFIERQASEPAITTLPAYQVLEGDGAHLLTSFVNIDALRSLLTSTIEMSGSETDTQKVVDALKGMSAVGVSLTVGEEVDTLSVVLLTRDGQ